MANVSRDQAQVYYDGMDALEAALGEADASRFVQLVRKGAPGDFTLDRRILIDAGEYDDLVRKAHATAQERSEQLQDPEPSIAGATA
jgi:hypothetical protein